MYLWLTGLQMHHAYATACHPASSLACSMNFTGRYGETAIIVSIALQAVPALIGAFAGAPVLARELETGTFRYAWTQGFGRCRWTLGKLVLLAVAVAAAAGAFTVLFSWYSQPFFAAGYAIPFSTRVFGLLGVAFAAWTLAAFAIGALAGMLIRRVVPAIAATLAVYAGLAFATALWLREHYMTPLVTSNLNLPGSAWVVSQWYTKGGKFAFGAHGSGIVRAVRQLCGAVGGAAPRGRALFPSQRPAVPRPARLHARGPATSPAAGSGPSSGSRAAGCSRCQCCSSPPPSGWSAAAPPNPPDAQATPGGRPGQAVSCRCCPAGVSRSMRVPLYPSDISDAEWAITEATLPEPAWKQGRGGRPAKRCRRGIVNAIRYLVKEGVQWRAVPADLRPAGPGRGSRCCPGRRAARRSSRPRTG